MLLTSRLVLRRWEPRDRVPFASLNSDPEVMRHFPAILDSAASDMMVAHLEETWANEGIGFAVAERRSDGAFLGMVGLSRMRMPEIGQPHDGALEVGWRLARAFWGNGYATEAAGAWIDYGFSELGEREIVSITVPQNVASQAVMKRLGMQPDPARSFEHPRIPDGHPLRPHVLYYLQRESGPGEFRQRKR